MKWTGWLGVGAAIAAGVVIHQLSERLRRVDLEMQRLRNEQQVRAARDARNQGALAAQVKELETQLEAAKSKSVEAAMTAETRVERWLGPQGPEAADASGWGPREVAVLEQIFRDRTRRIHDRIRAGSGLLQRRTSAVLGNLLTSDDTSDVIVALGAWASTDGREEARSHLAKNPSAQAAVAAWLRLRGESSRSTAMWLLHDAGDWAESLLPALRSVLSEPAGGQDVSVLREWAARVVIKRADVESEPLLAEWAAREPQPRQRGWILYHLVALHEALRPTGAGTVPDATVGGLLDGALTWADRPREGEHYVIPVMALAAIGKWPRWLEGRAEAVRQLASAGHSIERDSAARALLEAGDAWALERLATWIPTLNPEVLLDLQDVIPRADLDALVVGVFGPGRRSHGAQGLEMAWPVAYRLLDYLRSRAGEWIGFPASLRNAGAIQKVFDPKLRFQGDPALLAHLQTLHGGFPPELSDALFRWLLAREGVPAADIEVAVRLRRALDTSSPEALVTTAGQLLSSAAVKRAPHVVPIERALWQGAGGR
jgi:hypothetical protein